MIAWLLGLWAVYLFITPGAAEYFVRLATTPAKQLKSK